MKYSVFVSLALALSVAARPTRRASFTLQNGQDAIALNDKFKTLTANSACTADENACVNNQFSQCVNGKFVSTACGAGEVCAALPLVNSAGTSITCTTQSDLNARIAATGAQGSGSSAASAAASSSSASDTQSASPTTTSAPAKNGAATNNGGGTNSGNGASNNGSNNNGNNNGSSGGNNSGNSGNDNNGGNPNGSNNTTGGGNDNNNGANNNNGTGTNNSDPQTSLTLDPSVIAKGFAQNGQGANGSEAGQVASLTSSNNFINFCAGVNQPITNGVQITSGSCNPAPMGQIPSTANMPSSKFTNPKNMDSIPANQDFTITMAIQNMETGNFVNADTNYFSAPQQLNGQGQIIGHSHVVVEQLSSLTQTTPTNPQKFAFFKGLNDAAQNGVLSADVTGGLPAGTYKLSSINTGANHAPALVPIAQHGSLDDAVYFTVTDNGQGSNGNGNNGTDGNNSSSNKASATKTSNSKGSATAKASAN